MQETRLVTRRGYKILVERAEKLEKKLQELQSEVGEQASTGGNQWHDNAGYEQLVIDIRGANHRLAEARKDLANIEIVEYPKNPDSVCIGCKVDIKRDGKSQTWIIVGFGETDIDNHMIAYDTPLAQAILGLKAMETTTAEISRKKVGIEIINIESFSEKEVSR